MDIDKSLCMRLSFKNNGSISVEAAAILPVFLLGFLALISIGFEILFEMKMSEALYLEARHLSLECYDGRNIALSEVEKDIDNILKDLNANYVAIDGGAEGIDYSQSELDNNEYVILRATYDFMPFGANIFGLFSIPVTRQCVMHIWCGYKGGFFGDGDYDYVYVTEDSDVYHINRECTHIRLTVEKVSPGDIDRLRNNGGSKYYSCEICHSKKSDAEIYITPEGNRFHNTVTCSGLKRTVRAIRVEQIGDRRPCTRCGR